MSASLQSRPDAVLREGDTIWCRRRAHRAALLLDGAGYFGALRSALLQARQSVIIAGWDIDSRTRLVGADRSPDDDGPAEFRQFLEYLVGRRDDLVVRLLLWDYSILYALEREPLPAVNLDWRTPSRVIVALDDALPIGGAHHQKLVVIDDTLAFCGGLDITVNRWDTPEHRPNHPERRGPSGEPYAPFHDVQMVVDGEAAAGLGQLVRERWKRATDHEPDPVVDASPIWPDGVVAEFEDVDIGIARTLPEDDDQRQVTEVKELYLESIRQARRYIYIENQYLTVEPVADALASRLREEPELEVVAVTPRRPSGWLETKTMGTGQALFMASLSDKDIRDRVRFYYPFSGQGDDRTAVMVHAKLMIVDDVLLHVGSSNLNRRSMGLDSECDLAIACGEHDACKDTIAGFRYGLLAEHLGVDPEEIAREQQDRESLIGAIESLAGGARTLRALDVEIPENVDQLVPDSKLIDPEQPVEPEELFRSLVGAGQRQKEVGKLLRVGMLLVTVLGMAAAWRWTPLSDWLNVDQLSSAMRWMEESRFTPLLVLGAFVIGGFMVIPLTLMVVATVMVLGPWTGLIYSLVGAELSAILTFAAGHWLGRDAVSRFAGSQINSLSRALSQRGLLTVVTLRIVPVAPFTVINVIAGVSEIRFRDFALGSFIGLLPGVIGIAFLADRVSASLEAPSASSLLWLAAAVAAVVALLLSLRHFLGRRRTGQSG